jgi:hypothetical protein
LTGGALFRHVMESARSMTTTMALRIFAPPAANRTTIHLVAESTAPPSSHDHCGKLGFICLKFMQCSWADERHWESSKETFWLQDIVPSTTQCDNHPHDIPSLKLYSSCIKQQAKLISFTSQRLISRRKKPGCVGMYRLESRGLTFAQLAWRYTNGRPPFPDVHRISITSTVRLSTLWLSQP